MINRPGEAQTVPITTRQLEAIVRLSEALAKMRLSAEATVVDVEEALRLFKVSTLAASQANSMAMASMPAGGSGEITRAEDFLRGSLPAKMTVPAKRILEEAQMKGFNVDVVRTCIRAMVLRNEVQEIYQGKMLKRLR